MKHLMLDIETLGTGHNAAILSVGACFFDDNEIGETFHQNINLVSCLNHGLDVDGSTFYWWIQQGKLARMALLDPRPKPLSVVLDNFSTFIELHYKHPEKVHVWGNGVSFDNVILRNAYKKTKRKAPWHYSRDMCYRTTKNLLGIKRKSTATHNALQDAIDQAKDLQEYLRKVAQE